MNTASIYIIGPGAVGLTLAVELSQHFAVNLIVKQTQNDQYKNVDIALSGAREGRAKREHFKFITIDELQCPAAPSYFFICVKAYDLQDCLNELKPKLNKEARVVLFSNGFSVYQEAAEFLERKCKLLRASASFGAQKLKFNEVLLSGPLNLSLAAPDGEEQELDPVSDFLTRIGAFISYPKDIVTLEWEKLSTNLIVNSIASILNAPNGVILENSELRELASELILEIKSVSGAEGFSLKDLTAESFFKGLEAHATNINSLLGDLRAKRRTEIPYIFDRFLRIADAYQIEVPRMRSLVRLLKSLTIR